MAKDIIELKHKSLNEINISINEMINLLNELKKIELSDKENINSNITRIDFYFDLLKRYSVILNKMSNEKIKKKTEIVIPENLKSECIKSLVKAETEDINKNIIVEECSELIKAITKYNRCKGTIENIKEELIDVLIVAQMTAFVFDISEEDLKKEYIKKMKRNLERSGFKVEEEE